MQSKEITTLMRQLALPLMLLAFVSNLAVLVSPIFMMQVLDRVVPSGNMYTLAMLLAVAMVALGLQAAVDRTRDKALQRSAIWLEGAALPELLSLSDPVRRQDGIDALAHVTSSLKGGAGATALNLPWLPLYFVALAFVHWFFVVLVAVIIALQLTLRFVMNRAQSPGQSALTRARNGERQSLSLLERAMASVGMKILEQNLVARHLDRHGARLNAEDPVDELRRTQSALSAFLRSGTQLLALSAGAGLVAMDMLSAGGMIAASIIVTKLATMVEVAVTSLPDLAEARNALGRLMTIDAEAAPSTEIPEFTGVLECRSLIHPRGGGAPPRLDRIGFQVSQGECLAILGASGSGKTTLLNALSGIDPAPIGAVFFDESETKALSTATMARHVGILPQRADLLEGTLAENICSFAPNPSAESIVAAARLAGVHGLISALPGGYDLDFTSALKLLSAGQKQRVALARAVYHRPRYLFLDEPNALLDAEGERQLCDAIARLKNEGTTVVMVVHRSGVLGLADKVLVLDNGRVSDFGLRSEVMARYTVGRRRIELPLNQNSLQDLSDWVGAQFTRAGDEVLQQKAVMVTTELFNVACAEAADSQTRRARLEFRFIDDHRCEITLSEDGQTAVESKMAKVESLIRHKHVPMVDLDTDEVALAMVAQVADAFDIRNDGDRAVFFAALSDASAASLGQERPH